jgi:CheY-like chemotaxis protein
MSAVPLRPCILVVDDDPMVARVVARVLSKLGDVTIADSATQGLAHLEAGGRCDLILTDVNMSGTSGVAFVEAVLERWPVMRGRITVMTGGRAPAEMLALLDDAPHCVVAKPFTPTTILETVSRRLEALAAASPTGG